MATIKQQIQELKDKISQNGNYTDDEIDFIVAINAQVQQADGIAEGWSYVLNSLDYIDISTDIFDMSKSFFVNQNNKQ